MTTTLELLPLGCNDNDPTKTAKRSRIRQTSFNDVACVRTPKGAGGPLPKQPGLEQTPGYQTVSLEQPRSKSDCEQGQPADLARQLVNVQELDSGRGQRDRETLTSTDL